MSTQLDIMKAIPIVPAVTGGCLRLTDTTGDPCEADYTDPTINATTVGLTMMMQFSSSALDTGFGASAEVFSVYGSNGVNLLDGFYAKWDGAQWVWEGSNDFFGAQGGLIVADTWYAIDYTAIRSGLTTWTHTLNVDAVTVVTYTSPATGIATIDTLKLNDNRFWEGTNGFLFYDNVVFTLDSTVVLSADFESSIVPPFTSADTPCATLVACPA